MKDFLIIVIVLGLGLIGYYYWQNHQSSLEVTQTRQAQCEEIMKTITFETQQESDDYFIDCLSGKVPLPPAGIHD